MAIDWATSGARKPSIKELRSRMGVTTGGTNPAAWCEAIESYDTPGELDGKYRFLSCADVTGSAQGWARLSAHVTAGKGAVLAVDYGVYRSLSPRKSGSTTFSGNHAVFVLGSRKRGSGPEWLIWDPLNDGRRAGIPDGPVWVSAAKVKASAEAVEKAGKTWAVLVWPGHSVPGETEPPASPKPPPPTLNSVLSDARELLDLLRGDPEEERVRGIIEDLEEIIGPAGANAFASADDEPGLEASSALEVYA